MRVLITILIIISFSLFYISCEDEKEDNTPPTVIITSPQDGSTVSEIVIITCISTDNEGVEKVELWVDGVSIGVIDNTEPYSLEWNTTTYEDSSSHTITVRSYDFSHNKMDSAPFTLTVDNSLSTPSVLNINSIMFDSGGLNIIWNKSTDEDFSSYSLEKSLQSDFGNSAEVFTSTNITDTSYFDANIDPLIFQYYRVTVSDIFNYSTTSEIVSSALDPIPSSVNIISVSYDTSSMVVVWEKSDETDFWKYDLHQSIGGADNFNSISIITNINTTQISLSDFDPQTYNYFRVVVYDTLGQFFIGNPLTNSLETPPTQVTLLQILYENNSFNIQWSENHDADFRGYYLYESFSEDFDNKVLIYETFNRGDTTYTHYGVEEEMRYYQVIVKDIFNIETSSIIMLGIGFIAFNNTYGGNYQDWGNSVQQTSDGGYIITGLTDSFGNGDSDVWLIKTNSQGIEEWNHTFGGSNSERGNSVQQTSDGGYIITGLTDSFGNGDYDFWLIKTNSQGVEEWNQTFGGSSRDWSDSVKETSDGGFIITGYTRSFGNGNSDVWLIKTNSQGIEEWNHTFGGSGHDLGSSVKETSDGGFIITGSTDSHGNGLNDIWLIKTNSQGIEEWNQTFGGPQDDRGYSVQETTDSGFIITGYTDSFGNGSYDFWLIKTNSQGIEEWNQTFGGFHSDLGFSVQQITDGGFVLTGYTMSFGNGDSDVWLIKTNSQGIEEWNHTFGGNTRDSGLSVKETSDGGFIITGSTDSYGNGESDFWLIKTDPLGNTVPY